MDSTEFSRRRFLGAASFFSLYQALGSPAPAATDPPEAGVIGKPVLERVDRALCLSGGGARGAYQAGIIDYFRLSKQIRDGEPLRPYGFVTGTSIGALNGYFVATGQYSLLRDLWYGIADQNVVVLKKQYAKVVNPNSGIGTRIASAMRLAISLGSSDTGVLDGDRLRAWMAKFIDPERRPLVPLVWAATNLTTQSAEFFYISRREATTAEQEQAAAALRNTVGPFAILREATPDILIDALRASAAIPIAFDPVALPTADGKSTNYFVDGGVTANTPIGAARAAAHNVDVVMLDPPIQNQTYQNAFDIGIGVFGTMQRRILETDVRSAYLEGFGKAAVASIAHPTPEVLRFANELFASEFFLVRPAAELSVGVVGFDDGENIYKTFKTGFADARSPGFTKYVYQEQVPSN